MNYDVAILGSGFGGALLAAILASQSMRVVMVDRARHPRFAIGESTVPLTSQMISLLAEEYGIDALHDLGMRSPRGLQKAVGSTSGVKRIFSFSHHKFDEPWDASRNHQFGNIWREDNHLFRPDVDLHVATLATGLGATLLESMDVTDFTIDEKGVTLALGTGGTISARFLVDATGKEGLLSKHFSLRDGAPIMEHYSRSIFTHMLNVRPFEDCVTNPMRTKWSQGTLHHIFDGGWIYVIPFGNWEGSTNPLVSVGLQLDPRRYPLDSGLEPEQEFYSFLERLPDCVQAQFRGSSAARPWVRTGRLQYSATQACGYRWALMPHAFGFVDPLFSQGLATTVEMIRLFVPVLTRCLRDDDFTVTRFSRVETFQHRRLSYVDRVVAKSFASWKHWELWNAWMRIWAIGIAGAESTAGSQLLMGVESTQPIPKDFLFSPMENPEYQAFFERAVAIFERFEQGVDTPATVATLLWEHIQSNPIRSGFRYASEAMSWALREPGCKELLFGDTELAARWEAKLTDLF